MANIEDCGYLSIRYYVGLHYTETKYPISYHHLLHWQLRILYALHAQSRETAFLFYVLSVS